MPLWRINTPAPGAYVEGHGIIPPGTEINLPEKHIVRRVRDGHSIRVRVRIKARASWEPLDDEAKVLFSEYRSSLTDKGKVHFDKLHAGHKGDTPNPDEEVLEDLIAAGKEEEPVDLDETTEPAKSKPAKASDKPPKRASDT